MQEYALLFKHLNTCMFNNLKFNKIVASELMTFFIKNKQIF